MKTQEQYMKQCISLSVLFLCGFVGIFWPISEGYAYTSIAPFQNEVGPAHGLILKPTLGYQATDANSVEANVNLNAAITRNFSVYGRYSVQTDQILGLSQRFAESRDYEISSQVEATDSQSAHFGVTGGIFARIPVSFFGSRAFTTEIGFGVHDVPAENTVSVPGSLLLTHHAETSGLIYGAGFRGESKLSDASTWVSFNALFGYENRDGIRYGLELALPATPITEENTSAISFHLVIPFGQHARASHFQPKVSPEIASTGNAHYNLDAKVVSQNEAMFLIKINKGSNDLVSTGQTFDIFKDDERVARAQVVAVKIDEAALNVVEYNQEHWIELGFSARRLEE